MCGIFGYIGNKENAGELILQGLKSLEYRGYDSWGVAVKDNSKEIFIEKHIGKIGEAHFPQHNSTIGIGHTRWATHGGVTDKNAHPHTDEDRKVIVVHNGIVENFIELKTGLLAKGHTFISETDTEILPHLIEEEMKTEKDLKKLMLKVFTMVHGMNAIIAFFPDAEKIYAVKNGSPVVFGKNNDELVLASDASALIPYTKEVYFLEDDELLEMGRNTSALYDNKGNEKKLEMVTLQYDKTDAEMGDFPHFMIKEIHEQPKILQNIIDTQLSNVRDMAEIIDKAYGTYFIGCGTASYAALAGTYLFAKIAKRHVNASIGSEFTYLEDFLKKDSLIVALSQSGETIDVISSMKKAKQKGANIMAMTNVLGSTLYRLADHKLLLMAGPEKAVCSTKAYIAKIAFLYLLAYQLTDKLDQGMADIQKAIQEVKGLLSNQESIKKLASHIKDKNHIFILGRGVSYPTAMESTLKIKEVSYIHAEGFAAGELKHGVIALIEKGTPVIVYNPEDETYDDTLSSAYEVKARGAYVIGVSSKRSEVYDEFIEVANCNDATIIPNVVISQLLGYYLAVEKGLDPDKPRNLAKSVTVK